MSKFDEVGFLAEDMQEIAMRLDSECGEHLEVCKKLNAYCQNLQYKLDIHNEDVVELLSATLFSRVLSTYQCALIISHRGMKQQFMMLIRCILESLFPLVAISKEHSFALELVKADKIEHLKSTEKTIKFIERNNIADANLADYKKQAEGIRTDIKLNGIKKIRVFDCAQRAGLGDWYDIIYAFMSSTLHSSVRSLEEALHMDTERSKILALKNEPELEGFEGLLITLAECLMRAMVAICSVFGLSEPEIVQECNKKLRQLRGEVD